MSAGAALAAPRPERAGLGVLFIALMAVCFVTLDSSVKLLGAGLPVLFILAFRYAFQAAAMALWLAVSRRRPGGAGFRSAHPRFQIARGTLLLTTSALSFWAVQVLPMAEFTALILLTPLLVTLLAGWVLREPVSLLRWAAVAGGFAGALIMVRPGGGVFGWGALLPLAAALSYAVFQVLTSKLSTLESPFTTHCWTGLVGTALALPPLLAWAAFGELDLWALLRGLDGAQWALLLLAGATGTVGHLFLILALGLAPASKLMPFMYLQIGVAGLSGWLVFNHRPDAWALAGMAVVAACGALGAWLNLRGGPAARPRSVVEADTSAD